MIFALILATLLGVALGVIFTIRALDQIMQDRLEARDAMWQQALNIQSDRARL